MANPEVRALADLLALHPLLSLAWRSAGIAGRFLRDERPELLDVGTKSSPTDSVTVMDRTAERLILDELLGDRPDDGILGEEGGAREGTSGVRWIVDPLDGTVNYLYRLPMWGVSIAAEEQGLVTVGVISTPAFDESYVGVRGEGAWLVRGETAQRLDVSDCSDLASALVTTGFGYDSEQRRGQGAVAAALIADIRDIRRMGAAVIDFCWLARGRVDAYYEYGLNEWDYAAGALIASESGAVVTGLQSDDFSDFMVAAAPGVAGDLRARLVALRAGDVGVSRGA